MYESITNCPVCKSVRFKHYLITKDHFLSKESFNISKCQECSLLFTNPRPSSENIGSYYDSEEYLSHNSRSGLLASIYKIIRRRNIQHKYNIIKSRVPKGKLLDVGAGTGSFLNFMQTKGWKVYGTEPNESARKQAVSSGINVVEDIGKLNIPKKMDAITMWHSLEHVHNFDETVQYLASHLKKKGRLFIAVPNHESLDASIYKEYWAAWDVPRHLYHFNEKSIATLANLNGLKLKEKLPMKFDAYYISLMSEQYKTGHKNIYKMILNGWKSNSYGKKTGHYSSMIYVLKKK